jgi:hypothetical protein
VFDAVDVHAEDLTDPEAGQLEKEGHGNISFKGGLMVPASVSGAKRARNQESGPYRASSGAAFVCCSRKRGRDVTNFLPDGKNCPENGTVFCDEDHAISPGTHDAVEMITVQPVGHVAAPAGQG